MTRISTKNNFYKLTGREEDHLKEFQGYLLHPDLFPSLLKLQEQAKKDIGADLKIISAFRNFERQEMIWNNKAKGIRPVYDDQDNKVNPNDYSPKDFIEKIMRFSMIPGASRHHWGSDFDIYDASKLSKDKVQLTPSECTEKGVFFELHQWLDEVLNTEFKTQFFRPYDQDLGGVSIEKWHLSFRPISDQLTKEYTLDIFIRNIEQSHIHYKEIILKNAEYYFNQYVMNITD